jgi:hypothetical protein
MRRLNNKIQLINRKQILSCYSSVDFTSASHSEDPSFKAVNVFCGKGTVLPYEIQDVPQKCTQNLDTHNSHINTDIVPFLISHLKSQIFRMSSSSTKFQINFSSASVPQSHSPFSSST